MSDTSTGRSDFFSAAATLRDTVKWLAAAFAGTAALIIGGSPLQGLGQLPRFSGPWWLALVLLVASFGFICAALWRAMRILKPDVLYRSSLLGTRNDLLTRAEVQELEALRATIDQRRHDLLPDDVPTLASLATTLAGIEARLAQLKQNNGPAQVIEEGETALDDHRAIVADLLPLAQYLRLKRRFEKEQVWMALFALLALLSLVGFTVVSTVPDTPTQHPITIHNECATHCGQPPPPPPQPTAFPALPPLRFEPGKARLSAAGLQAIQTARDAMNDHPRALLLVQAHTDTMASQPYNQGLAQRRALAVLPLLSSQGGIAPARVLVAYLPETALPHVTPDQTPDAENRSVRLVMIDDTRP